MPISLFDNLSEKAKTEGIESLIKHSSPTQDFFFMISISVLMVTLGILAENIAIVVGAMLVAPILYPILSLSLGITIANKTLIKRSLTTTVKSFLLGVFCAAVISLLISSMVRLDSSILLMLDPSLFYFGVAILAGLAGSFAYTKPKMNEALPGVAISVALLPPIGAVGIGIARFNWSIIGNSLLLLLVNIIGITFASIIVFSLFKLYPKREIAEIIMKEEEEKMEETNKQKNI